MEISKKNIREGVLEHYPDIRRVVQRIAQREGIVDDLTQECCLRIIQKEELFKGDIKTLGYWMKRVSKNLAINVLSREKKLQSLEDQNLIEDPQEQEKVFDEETIEWVLSQFKSLSEEQKKVLHMKYFQDKKLVEIAAELETSHQVISYQLKKALNTLRGRAKSQGLLSIFGLFFKDLFPKKKIKNLSPKTTKGEFTMAIKFLLVATGIAATSSYFFVSNEPEEYFDGALIQNTQTKSIEKNISDDSHLSNMAASKLAVTETSNNKMSTNSMNEKLSSHNLQKNTEGKQSSSKNVIPDEAYFVHRVFQAIKNNDRYNFELGFNSALRNTMDESILGDFLNIGDYELNKIAYKVMKNGVSIVSVSNLNVQDADSRDNSDTQLKLAVDDHSPKEAKGMALSSTKISVSHEHSDLNSSINISNDNASHQKELMIVSVYYDTHSILKHVDGDKDFPLEGYDFITSIRVVKEAGDWKLIEGSSQFKVFNSDDGYTRTTRVVGSPQQVVGNVLRAAKKMSTKGNMPPAAIKIK